MKKLNYELRRVRKGKTARDRARGAFERNAANKRMRADYQQDWLSKGNKSGKAFPKDTCNGKRNRYATA